MKNNEFIALFLDLVDGLLELRINNIIHSDVKPDNILMNKKGKCFYSDFGMEYKIMRKKELTVENKGLTILYWSPEQMN